MKKLIYFLLGSIVLVITFNMNIVINRNNISGISLQNIEALSYAESTEQLCFGIGSIDCPTGHTKVLWLTR